MLNSTSKPLLYSLTPNVQVKTQDKNINQDLAPQNNCRHEYSSLYNEPESQKVSFNGWKNLIKQTQRKALWEKAHDVIEDQNTPLHKAVISRIIKIENEKERFEAVSKVLSGKKQIELDSTVWSPTGKRHINEVLANYIFEGLFNTFSLPYKEKFLKVFNKKKDFAFYGSDLILKNLNKELLKTKSGQDTFFNIIENHGLHLFVGNNSTLELAVNKIDQLPDECRLRAINAVAKELYSQIEDKSVRHGKRKEVTERIFKTLQDKVVPSMSNEKDKQKAKIALSRLITKYNLFKESGKLD